MRSPGIFQIDNGRSISGQPASYNFVRSAGGKDQIAEHDSRGARGAVMHYDLGYFDLEQKTLQPLDNPFGTRLSPMS